MKILTILLFLGGLFNFSNSDIAESAAPPPMLPDLSIEGVTVSMIDCETASYSVIVCNNGTAASPATGLQLQFEPCPFDFELISQKFASLPPRTCRMITGTFSTECGCLGLNASIDPFNTVLESNESNNWDSGFDCC